MYAIELKDVVKDYTHCGQPAVDGLNLRVGHGEIVTLLGPSGCGKTTTLRLIAGFERADTGTISLAGSVVSDGECFVTPDKRGIGMVFQDYALFPHLTVAQNVGFGCKPAERTQRTQEMLELVELPDMGDRYPH
ncbi:MAG TPA: ABC transporter ATP-binding protein, partial [Bacillota bacterium]|nr:ABC transporter ATP-binding protein [Bacillota bacterium]